MALAFLLLILAGIIIGFLKRPKRFPDVQIENVVVYLGKYVYFDVINQGNQTAKRIEITGTLYAVSVVGYHNISFSVRIKRLDPGQRMTIVVNWSSLHPQELAKALEEKALFFFGMGFHIKHPKEEKDLYFRRPS